MKKKSPVILIICAALCLWAGGRTSQCLLNLRQAYQLDLAAPTDKAPPLVVFSTVALGGLRGMVADILWVKATTLQESGRYFEIAQVADWITKLEPQFATGWAFHGWNMAYNISYMFPNPEDRWRWINNGLRLIRDEGLKYNPANPELYKEIGWIYQHKIGEVYDTAHMYYKKKLASEISLITGPTGFIDRDADMSRELRTLLLEKFGMTPESMIETDSIYGPLDWRLPESHAIYWAYQGKKSATERHRTYSCDQMLIQNMGKTFTAGRLYFDPESGAYARWPRFDLVNKAISACEQAVSEHDSDIFRWASANLIARAVFVFHLFGFEEDAKLLFATLNEKFPGPNNPDYDTLVNNTFEAFKVQLSREGALLLINGLLYRAALHRNRDAIQEADQLTMHAKAIHNAHTEKIEAAGLKASLELPAFDLLVELAEKYASGPITLFRRADAYAARARPADSRPGRTPLSVLYTRLQ